MWRRTWGGAATVAKGFAADDAQLERFELDELEDGDGWHEYMRTGEASYNLVLPGGIRIHAPQIIQSNVPAPIRVAWMPNNDELLRAEATLIALEPNEEMTQYLPPRLVTFRADELDNRGDKPGDPLYVDPPEEYDDGRATPP